MGNNYSPRHIFPRDEVEVFVQSLRWKQESSDHWALRAVTDSGEMLLEKNIVEVTDEAFMTLRAELG